MRIFVASVGVVVLFTTGIACGGDDDVQPGASSGGTSGEVGGSSGTTSSGSPVGSSGATSSGETDGYTPQYGRFGVPTSTFTLPAPAAEGDGKPPALYFPHLQSSFPEVDWANLDRLYLPAGEYRTLCLGDLPIRTAERPLVITNLGGQVKVGGYAQGYVAAIGCAGGAGGANWVLTGRYDPTSKTGDAGFRGHAEGAYASSQGTYGIFFDDAFSKVGNSGLAVGGRATDFELEVIEVARAEFAGVIAKTNDDATATMSNVRFHDMYVHDTGSEGIYFGSTQAQPQHTFEKLHVHDNRLIRTGTEALQVGQLGDGCEVDHNVLGPAAMRWRSAFEKYQDGNVQLGQRHGSSTFHHNVVTGTGDLFVEFFPQPVAGDAHGSDDTVRFTDNYFADSALGGGASHKENNSVTLRMERNAWTGFHFTYDQVYPDTAAPLGVFHANSGSSNPNVFVDNTFEGIDRFMDYPQANVTDTHNVAAAVPRVAFRNFMNAAIEANVRTLEWWTATATLAAGTPPVTYPVGFHVMHQGELYEALAANAGQAPDTSPAVWKKLPAPADDVRLRADSAHAGLGVRWPPAEP